MFLLHLPVRDYRKVNDCQDKQDFFATAGARVCVMCPAFVFGRRLRTLFFKDGEFDN